MTRKISDIFIVCQAALWYLVSIIGGAKTLEFLDILVYEQAVVLVSLVVLMYVTLAGMKVVILTDIIQAAIILGFTGMIIAYLPTIENTEWLEVASTEVMPWTLIVGFFIYGFFSSFSSVDRFPLIFAAKDYKAARKGMLWGLMPILVMMSMLLVVGTFIFAQNPSLNPDTAFLELFNYLPETLFSLAAVMLFAGLMSSADTNVYIMSSFISMIRRQEGVVSRTKKISVGIVALGVFAALVFPDILGITIFVAGFSLLISVSMIYVISGGTIKEKFFSSFLGATILFILGLFIVGVEPSVAIFPVMGGGLGLLVPAHWTQWVVQKG